MPAYRRAVASTEPESIAKNANAATASATSPAGDGLAHFTSVESDIDIYPFLS